jgi:hypothetical protein
MHQLTSHSKPRSHQTTQEQLSHQQELPSDWAEVSDNDPRDDLDNDSDVVTENHGSTSDEKSEVLSDDNHADRLIKKGWKRRSSNTKKSTHSTKELDREARAKAMRLQPIQNFAWKHPHLDIHQAIATDMLHVFYSNGMVQYVLDWMLRIIDPEFTQKVQRAQQKKGKKGPTKLDTRSRVDDLLLACPAFPNFKRLNRAYSSISQKTGNEMKTLSKILVPALGPILATKSPLAALFLRAFSDFLMVAHYYAQDETTLGYLSKYLEIMNICKPAIREAKAAHKRSGEKSLDFPKFHAMIHVMDSIREFGTVDGTNTELGELLHGLWIKKHAKYINFRIGWESQILRRLDRHQLQLIVADWDRFNEKKEKEKAEIIAHITTASRCKEIPAELYVEVEAMQFAMDERIDFPTSTTAYMLSKWEQFPERAYLSKPLVAFVREQRQQWKTPGSPAMNSGRNQESDRLDKDIELDPINGLPLVLHPSIAFWIPDSKSRTEDDVRVYARCSWNFQKEGYWRRDWVWAKEYANSDTTDALNGYIPVQLLLVFTVMDIQQTWMQEGSRRKGCRTYTGALVREYRPIRAGKSIQLNPIHGLAEFRSGSMGGTRQLGSVRVYPIETLGPHVHMYPVENKLDTYYMNPYMRREDWNRIWDDRYFQNGDEIAETLAKQWEKGVPERDRELDKEEQGELLEPTQKSQQQAQGQYGESRGKKRKWIKK